MRETASTKKSRELLKVKRTEDPSADLIVSPDLRARAEDDCEPNYYNNNDDKMIDGLSQMQKTDILQNLINGYNCDEDEPEDDDNS
jgi:hypothetical protein